MSDVPGRRPRAVVLVGNPANPYSRAIRVGRALIDEGYDVEIASAHEPGAPLEERHGEIVHPALSRERDLRATHGRGARRERERLGRGRPRPRVPAETPSPVGHQPGPPCPPQRTRRVDLLAAHRARLVAHAGPRAGAGRPVPRLRHPAHRRRAGRPRTRPQSRSNLEGHLRRHRHHDRVEQRPAHPAPRAALAGPPRAPLGREGRCRDRGDRGVRRLGRRALDPDAPPDRGSQLPGAVDAAGGTAARPHPGGHRVAADDPDPAVLGPSRAVRRAGPGGRGDAPGARHRTRRCSASAAAGTRAWRATPTRATPAATSPCRPSIPTSCPSGSPRPTWR